MSSSNDYSPIDPPKRFSCPTGDVAQRFSSAWLLECCCSRCYPWKRSTRSACSALNVVSEHKEGTERATENGESIKVLLDKSSDTKPDKSLNTTEVESSVKVTLPDGKSFHDDHNNFNMEKTASWQSKNEIEVKVSEFSETGAESVLTSMIFNVPQKLVNPVAPKFLKVGHKKNNNGVTFGKDVVLFETIEESSESSLCYGKLTYDKIFVCAAIIIC